MRIKKFGEVTNENTKKDLRAKRFGESVAASGGENGSAAEKKALRAQRFGVAESEAAASGVISPEVLEKRAQRFGIVEEKAANGVREKFFSFAAGYFLFIRKRNKIFFFFCLQRLVPMRLWRRGR